MINDEDSHIRRNIVLVSSGILLAAWLELPGSSMLRTLLPADANIEQYKLWAVGFALLLYLGLRYRFSEDGKKSIGTIKQQIREEPRLRGRARPAASPSQPSPLVITGIPSAIIGGDSWKNFLRLRTRVA